MIQIDNKIIADEIIQEHFQCNLNTCKGQCCVEGICGAPLNEDEKKEIELAYPIIKKYLSAEAVNEIENQGLYTYFENNLVTPTIGTGICVYGIKDKNNIVKCAFEKAYYKKEIHWKKPISCNLFPIRISQTQYYELLNYEKIDICDSGCKLGNTSKIKIYEFLKEPLIKKYGTEFYQALVEIDMELSMN